MHMLRGIVIHGDQTGRTLGFPTVNFEVEIFPKNQQEGIYTSTVSVDHVSWPGVLYYGPRIALGETKSVLEIHLIGFSGDLYGRELHFTVGEFIRPPRDFASTDDLIQQLEDDRAQAEKLYHSSSAQ
jgi:riboflavin kinase/FMN adenylyltransferase